MQYGTSKHFKDNPGGKISGFKNNFTSCTTFNKRKEKGLSIKKLWADEKPRAADLYPS